MPRVQLSSDIALYAPSKLQSDFNQHCRSQPTQNGVTSRIKTMEDPTLSSTIMEAPLYLQLLQQLIELQRENIELWKEGIWSTK